MTKEEMKLQCLLAILNNPSYAECSFKEVLDYAQRAYDWVIEHG